MGENNINLYQETCIRTFRMNKFSSAIYINIKSIIFKQNRNLDIFKSDSGVSRLKDLVLGGRRTID